MDKQHVQIGTHPIEQGHYLIPTKEVLRLMGSITKIVNNRLPGMIVYGRPRIGKTSALKFAIEHLPTDLGAPLPILIANSNYLYKKNADSFHTLDRYISKKLINHHYQCIRQFEQLLKNENDEFPEICPIAYAYVNWKKGVLKKEHFYRDTMRNKIPLISGRYGYEL